jgi:hypothetical protein
MKRKDAIVLVGIALVSGFLALMVSRILFNASVDGGLDTPVVKPISQSFPDVYNDPKYKSFLNSSSLDFTQSIQIGDTVNVTPFRGNQ